MVTTSYLLQAVVIYTSEQVLAEDVQGPLTVVKGNSFEELVSGGGGG